MSANVHSMITSKRQVTQGPDGTPATKTIKSVQMIQYRVREIQQFFDNIYPAYQVDLSAIQTLVCEHLFATLRSKTLMPDVLEVSRLFANVLNENMKQFTDCGFRYFTHRRSHYVAPGRHISIPELELLSIPESRKLTKEEKRKMRNWRIEHAKSASKHN